VASAWQYNNVLNLVVFEVTMFPNLDQVIRRPLVLAVLCLSQAATAAVDVSAMPYLGKLTPVKVPDCLESSSTTIVSNYDDLVTAIANPLISVICMDPGRYGEIRLERAGSLNQPKFLIPNHAMGEALPQPWRLAESARVVFDERISFLSSNWFVVGIAVTSDWKRSVDFAPNSFGNVMESVLIEGASESLDSSEGDRNMIRMSDGSFYNTIQKSVARNSPRVPYADSHCVGVQGSRYNTLIQNEIYDCAGDGIQLLRDAEDGAEYDSRGNKIIENEFYVTPRRYADCEDPSENANLNGPGECACAENGLDIKLTSREPTSSPQERTVVRSNVLYGFREAHQSCGGSGDKGAPAIYVHCADTFDAWVNNNVVFDSDTGIQFTVCDDDAGPSGISVFNNLLYNIRKKGAFQIYGGYDNRFVNNTIILTSTEDAQRNSVKLGAPTVATTVANNLTISESLLYTGYVDPEYSVPESVVLKSNAYLAMAKSIRNAKETLVLELPDEPLANYDALCVERQFLTGDAETCIPYVVPNDADAAAVDGIPDAESPLWFDLAYRLRRLPYDFGAVEFKGRSRTITGP